MIPSPSCEIHITRSGLNEVIVLSPEWLDYATLDTGGLVASVLVRPVLFTLDDGTEFSHAIIANIRYEITKREIVESGWRLWLHCLDDAN